MRILAQRAASQASKVISADNEKPKYEYDSDEDTEGGTWEHKKRKKEMSKTQGWLNFCVSFARYPCGPSFALQYTK